ncbi:MAG: hypothetical protein AAGK04_13000, partial [Planctomycetota bacterium]
SALAVFAVAGAANAQELTTNGDFETGDLTGWDTSFLLPGQTFNLTGDAASGSFAGEIFNDLPAQGGVIKQANIGIGTVNPGDEIQISFKAKGNFLAGGVLFAEFFSELDGGGTSSSEILSGGPLFVSNETEYQMFSFTTTAGPDVSGGVTLQFNAGTGGAPGSLALAFIDDVSVVRVPTPASAAVLGLGGLVAMRRRR